MFATASSVEHRLEYDQSVRAIISNSHGVVTVR